MKNKTQDNKEQRQSSLSQYCARNREAHAKQPGGWNYYIQNLYLSLNKSQQD